MVVGLGLDLAGGGLWRSGLLLFSLLSLALAFFSDLGVGKGFSAAACPRLVVRLIGGGLGCEPGEMGLVMSAFLVRRIAAARWLFLGGGVVGGRSAPG